MDYSAQNSVTIKRLRNNNGLTITFDGNTIPLMQGVDKTSGVVSPDWSNAANQPTRTPRVTSYKGSVVTLINHSWKYNGVVLIFNGSVANGYQSDSTGKFALNPTNGSIKIISNLASKINVAGDTLEYSCTAIMEGVEYSVSKELPIDIQMFGASSYYGSLTATTSQLTSTVTSTVINTMLMLSGANDSEYYIKWYKGTQLWSSQNGKKSITVTRDDVDGMLLIIAEFYKSEADTVPVAKAGITIADSADEFRLILWISSANQMVDEGSPVTVSAKIMNMTKNNEYTPSSASWKLDVISREDFSILKTSSTASISVSTSETDRNGQMYDVEVLGTVDFN